MSLSSLRRMRAAANDSASQIDTPYGKIVKTFEVDRLTIRYICPLAFLHQACSSSKHFANTFVGACVGNVGRVSLYVDEVTLGNALRPDKGRAYQAVYWSLLDMPSWVHERCATGWFTAFYVQTTSLRNANVSISKLLLAFMRVVWNPTPGEWNAATIGIRLPFQGSLAHVKLKFTCFWLTAWLSKKYCRHWGPVQKSLA